MSRTVLEIAPEERRAYELRAIVERREATTQVEGEERWQQARKIAGQAASVLKKRFGAARVILFGSAARRDWFTQRSDIDLAVWGVPPGRFYAAVAVVTGASPEIGIDIVDAERCSAVVLAAIERDGVEL